MLMGGAALVDELGGRNGAAPQYTRRGAPGSESNLLVQTGDSTIMSTYTERETMFRLFNAHVRIKMMSLVLGSVTSWFQVV